jgi:hypothetical protein
MENPPILLSLYALREKPAGFEDFRLLEWTPSTGGGHPSWAAEAAQLRIAGGDPAGPLLRPLLRRYGVTEDPPMLVVVGFSAGANSGLREVLRHRADRDMIAAALSIDGLHAATKSWVPRSAPNPADRYFDWTGQVGPLQAMLLEAAPDSGRFFAATSSDVAGPGPNLTQSSEAWDDVIRHSQIATSPANVPLSLKASDGGARVRLLEGRAIGPGALVLDYAGKTARDHVQQASAVAPWLLSTYVAPLVDVCLGERRRPTA